MEEALFYCPTLKQNPQLSEQESQHCVKVLRMKEGDKLTVTDGLGYFYQCSILQAHPKHCILNIETETCMPRSWKEEIQLAFAPTKNMDRNEWFVEKATEIGINRFSPLLTSFSERKEIKNERLQKVAVSAMKQSQQAFLPKIDEIEKFNQFIRQPFQGQKFIAHCYNSEKRALSESYKKGENALILIGPEGDFSPEEVEGALKNGFIPISLGENRLRTETACLVAVHTIHVLNSKGTI